MLRTILLLILLVVSVASGQDATHRIYTPPVEMTTADATLEAAPNLLPPLPDGVSQLRFRDLFTTPVGPRGLEFSTRLRELEGRRVRVLGYMVREDMPVGGRLLLAPFPLTLFTREYGQAEDLPPTVIHVFVADAAARRRVPFTPGLLLLTGAIEIGAIEEADGRVSVVRLRLDPPPEPTGSDATSLLPSSTQP